MTANVGALSVTITAVDKATAVINRVKTAISGTNAPVGQLGKALQGLGNASGLSRLGSGFGNLAASAMRAAGSLTSVAGPMGLITGAGTLYGMARLVDSWGRFADTLGLTSARLQMNASSLQSMQGASRLLGGTAEAMTESFRGFREVMTDAAGGRNNEALGYLSMMRVGLRNAAGGINKGSQGFYHLADAISRIGDPELQVRVMRTFGVAESLWPVIRKGSGALREYEARARRYGVVNEGATVAARKFREAQEELGLALSGMGNSIAEKLAPAATWLFHNLAELIVRAREVPGAIAQAWGNLTDFFGRFWGRIRQAFGPQVQWLADTATLIGEGLVGKIKTAWEGLVKVFEGVWKGITDPFLQIWEKVGPIIDRLERMRLSSATGSNPETQAERRHNWNNRGLSAPGAPQNNPLNMRVPGGAGFQSFDTAEAGLEATARQLLRYQDRYGLNTVSGIVSRWAPPNENDTGGYISGVSRRMGVGPGQALNLRDPDTMGRLIRAMGIQEGTRNIDAGALQRGVTAALGPYSSGAAQPGGGEVNVRVTIGNAPAGTRATASASGGASVAPPRVETAMPGYAGP